MTNHEQTQENLAAYLAGGLSAHDRGEFEAHVATCDACARTLADARAMERSLADLFAPARPDAELEDRALAAVRRSRVRRASILRFVAAAAAVLILGMVGSAVQAIAVVNWSDGPSARNDLRVARTSLNLDDSRSMQPMSLSEDKLPVDYFSRKASDFTIVDVDPARPASNKDIQFKSDRVDHLSVRGFVDIDGKELAEGGGFGLGHKFRVSDKKLGERGSDEESKESLKRNMRVDTKAPALGLLLQEKLESGVPMYGAYHVKPGKADGATFTTVGSKIGYLASDSEKAPLGGAAFYSRGKAGDPAKTPPPSEKDKLSDKNQAVALAPAPKDAPPKLPEPMPDFGPKIIYTGETEFEVESYDKSKRKVIELIDKVNAKVTTGTRAELVTDDRSKQANGKSRGYIVVRVPPGKIFDTFIEDLRSELEKFGELKSQRIGSQDVTKQYTDTASELRAARLVEKRLIEIIETKKGEIKDLVAAEATLGTWRAKIEKMEGEIRYYNNQVARCTLTITLVEKDIGTPASLVVTERVQMRLEVEEVKKALDAANEALRLVKGRVLKSEWKQHKAGQFEAVLHAEVPPAQKGAFSAKLAELGVVAENEAAQKTSAEGGSGKPAKDEPRISDVVFEVTFNNIVNIRPRHSVSLDVATSKVQESYEGLKKVIKDIAKSQIRTDKLNEQDKQRVTAELEFNVPSEKKKAVDDVIEKLGPVLKKTSVQTPITETATEQKFGYSVTLYGPGSVAPREVVQVKVEVKDVDKRIDELRESVRAGKGRVADVNVIRSENGQVSAVLILDVPLAVQDLIVLKAREGGNLINQQAQRNPNVPDNELATARIEATLQGVFAGKQPREKIILNLEVNDMDKTAAQLRELVAAAKGRVADSKVEGMATGQVLTTLDFDVPMSARDTLVKQIKDGKREVSFLTATNASVPDNELATARISVTLGTPRPVGPSDSGMGSFARRSLDWSVTIFSYCILALIAGLSAVLPVGIAVYVCFKLISWSYSGGSRPAPNT